jgi:ribosome maturation factor RimP
MNTARFCAELAEPVARELRLLLWDVRFEKEGSGWYLRYLIDKEGGVAIDDCERFSRRVDKLLDETDPIEQSYILEVSSPGVERELIKPEHFERFAGSLVRVRLIRPAADGVRELTGILSGLEAEMLVVAADGSEKRIPRADIAFVRLIDSFEYKQELREIDDEQR